VPKLSARQLEVLTMLQQGWVVVERPGWRTDQGAKFQLRKGGQQATVAITTLDVLRRMRLIRWDSKAYVITQAGKAWPIPQAEPHG
jgi:hypothetical protein